MNTINGNIQTFLRQHASVIFIFILFALGGILLPVGFILRASESNLACGTGTIILQLSGSLIAVALTAVFVSLPDLRNYLSRVVAALFSSGDVVPVLSDQTKSTLIKRLHLEAVSKRATDVEPTLFQHLKGVMLSSIATPYLTNYHCSLTLTRDQSNPDLIICHSVMSYRVHVHNLSQGQTRVPIRFHRETKFPNSHAHLKDKWVRKFSLKLGSDEFGKDDATFKTSVLGDSLRLRILFEREMSLKEDVDFSSTMETVEYNSDPVNMVFARYPCQGFHVSLMFEEGYLYDGAWFMHCSPESDIPKIGDVDRLRNGISARTNAWLLPGEGVTLYYFEPPGNQK